MEQNHVHGGNTKGQEEETKSVVRSKGESSARKKGGRLRTGTE